MSISYFHKSRLVVCLSVRGVNCAGWEAEINARVARLYGLTPEEIKLVEGEK